MTVDIQPIKCFINEGFLFKNDSKNYLEGKIIGISSYQHCLPSFQVLIQDSYLYSDVSLSELTHDKSITNKPKTVTCSTICPNFDIDVFKHDIFKDRLVSFFDIQTKVFKKGVYLLSLDFYTDNEMIHLLKGTDGYFYMIPNHKINWKGIDYLPTYKKKITIK